MYFPQTTNYNAGKFVFVFKYFSLVISIRRAKYNSDWLIVQKKGYSCSSSVQTRDGLLLCSFFFVPETQVKLSGRLAHELHESPSREEVCCFITRSLSSSYS